MVAMLAGARSTWPFAMKKMEHEMLDHNERDKEFLKYGWFYDNGWLHDSVSWDCYTDNDYGSADGYLVILSKNGKGCVLKVNEMTKENIWAGPIRTELDIVALMEFIRSFK